MKEGDLIGWSQCNLVVQHILDIVLYLFQCLKLQDLEGANTKLSSKGSKDAGFKKIYIYIKKEKRT